MPSSHDTKQLNRDLAEAVAHDNSLIQAEYRAEVRRALKERKEAGRTAAMKRRKEQEK